jgi:prephenate dehydratase
MSKDTDPAKLIAFQGHYGAYSDMACRAKFPDLTTMPCESFEDTFAAVREGRAGCAMIPIENSVAGRVADIHHLLPDSGLNIVGEHFQRVNHKLLAPKGAKIDGLKRVLSHEQALSQCRNYLREHGLNPHVYADTAGAAELVAGEGDVTQGAIASRLAGEIYRLEILADDIEDAVHNTTRFVIMTVDPIDPPSDNGPVLTSFVFQVRNVPAALYKTMGGFATNGVNMTKLESYMLGGDFNATQFYADVEGHPDHTPVRLALEELSFFSRVVKILGVYPADPARYDKG